MRPGVGGAPEPAVGGGRDAPLLCLIDGARWLDRPSEKALAFASAVFSRGRSPWCSQPASRSRSSKEELDRYDVRGLKNPRGYPGAALTCRVCGRMIVAEEALRVDVCPRAIAERLAIDYGLRNHRGENGACSSGGDAATTNRRPFTNK